MSEDIESFELLENAFETCRDLSESEREEWLNNVIGDEELRKEIRSLCQAHSEASGFLGGTIGRLAAAAASDKVKVPVGRQFGKYSIVREIGSGGMGAVFLAERNDGQFDQQVAIKIIRQSLADRALIEQFARERRILGSLDHPNIAKLFDGGVSETGEPYLVMEYIKGKTLLDHALENDLDLYSRLRLFGEICRAVSYAHANLVIHRDLKPSNILVTNTGVPKLLDFGLAKVLSDSMSPKKTATTVYPALTPAYASPEQLRGEPITTASDVYSLGVVLYELLTSRRPYALESYSYGEVLRAVSTSEPVPPSSVSARSEKSVIRTPALKGDLDNVILMALCREPERRYGSVEAFARDLERYLNGRPVSARANTVAYRARKFIARNKVAATAAAVAFFVLVAGVVGVLYQANIAQRQRDLALAEQSKAEKISLFMTKALAYSIPTARQGGTNNAKDATITQMLDDLAPRIETELADQPEVRANVERTIGVAYTAQSKFDRAEKYLGNSLTTFEQIYGPDGQEVAATLIGLGEARSLKGDYKNGTADLQRAIDIFHKSPPDRQEYRNAMITGLVDLAGVAWTMGDFAKADQGYSEALTIGTSNPETERIKIALARSGLGLTRYGQGRMDEAIEMLSTAVSEYRQIPDTNWALPEALNYLGQAQLWSGKYDEALSTLHESERLALQIFGESSPMYNRSLWLQTYALCMSGRCQEALKTIKRSEELRQEYFPANDVLAGNGLDGMALVYNGIGQPQRAETCARQAIEHYSKSTPPGSPTMTLARLHLGEALVAEKKLSDAEAVLKQALIDATAAQGADHWRTKMIAERLNSLR